MNLPKILFAAVLLLLTYALPVKAQPETGGFMSGGDVKSEEAAISNALINTVMPVAVGYGTVKLFGNNTVESVGATLAVYGLVMGPSTGNFYANDYLRGGLGALTRLGAAFLLQDATSEIFGREFANALHVDNSSVSLKDTDILIGSVLLVGTMAYNIISAPASAREYNQSMGYSMNIESLRGTGRPAPVVTARFNF